MKRSNRLLGAISNLAIIAVLSTMFLVAVSYQQIRKFAGRRVYSTEKLEKKALQRADLVSISAGQPVSFETADHVDLAGILFVRPQAQRTILVVHGYRMTKERLRNFPNLFPDDNLLIFDTRAHGQSSGEWVTFGFHEKQDVLAAAHFLQNNQATKNTPLYAIGISMGSVALLAAAAQEQHLFKAIVLDSPFAHLEEQILRVFERKTGLPRLPFSRIMQKLFEYFASCCTFEVDARTYAKKIMVPTMVIHAYDDRLVPVEDAQVVFDMLPEPKRLWIVENSRHARAFKTAPDEYRKRVNLFFEAP